MSTMREEFEKWVLEQPELTHRGSLERYDNGYAYGPTQIAWISWQAATEQALEKAAKRCEDACGLWTKKDYKAAANHLAVVIRALAESK